MNGISGSVICFYNPGTPGVFKGFAIQTTSTTIQMLWHTGPNAAKSPATTLGYSNASDSIVATNPTFIYSTLVVNARTFNYIKLYNLSTDPLSAYTIQGWGGSSWVTIATFSAANRTGGGLDIYDFSGAGTTFTYQYIRALITGTTNSDAASIVALEVYYKYDVTSRCTSIKTDRQRDWKQVNPMAATAELAFDNSDQFFSPYYAPTTTQVATGFFNSEIDVGLKVVVQTGFWYSGTPYFDLGFGQGGFGSGPYGGGTGGSNSAPEIVNSFVGTIDTWTLSSKNGSCKINARDGMKDVINQTWSTRLKYGIDIGAAVQYILNICNVSNYEMNVNTTGLLIPYFFVYETSAYSAIQQLVVAAGSAQYWVDENGIHQFANLLASSSNSHTDFTWTAVSPTGVYASYNNGGSLTVIGNGFTLSGGGSPSNGITAALAATQANGWQFTFTTTGSFSAGLVMFAAVGDGTGLSTVGYGLLIENTQILFNLYTGSISSYTTLATYSGAPSNPASFTILRDASGHFYIWMDGVLIITLTTDTTYTSFDHFTVTASGTNANFTVSNINFLNTAYTMTFAAGVMTMVGPPINQGAVTAEGNLAVGFSPSNAPITYQTRTANNISMSGATSWATVTINSTTQSGPITSAVNTYVQYQFYFSVGSGIPLWAPYYATANWSLSGAAGSVRALRYDSSVCDISQQLSDSLGGDSSILNYFEVISSPLILTGTTSTVQWTATTGQPVNPVSAGNPLIVNTGTISIQAVVAGGMDISLMSGTNPAAVAVTWGTATGSVTITYIHPTKPIITLTVTGAGTITNLQLIGQALSSQSTPIDIIAGDATSQSKYRRRTTQISNNFIPNAAVAQLIANTQLSLFKTPAAILSGLELLLTPSVQLTDQVQVTDLLLSLSSAQTWNVSGISHEITKASDQSGATIKTSMKCVALSH
jgi:hypothetical protein